MGIVDTKSEFQSMFLVQRLGDTDQYRLRLLKTPDPQTLVRRNSLFTETSLNVETLLMDRRYKLSRKGKIVGDFPLAELKAMREHGMLQKDDHLWGDGMTEWQNAERFLTTTNEASEPPRTAEKKRAKTALLAVIWISIALTLIPILCVVAYLALNQNRADVNEAYPAANTPQATDLPPAPSVTSAPTLPRPMLAAKGERPGVVQDYTFTGFGFDGKELFPSSVLAYASIKPSEDDQDEVEPDAADDYSEGFSSATIAIGGVRKGDKFQVTISGDRFIKPSKLDFVVEEDTDYITASPTMIYDYEALAKLRQSTPFNVTYTIQRQGEAAKTQSETWIAHQINDCQTATANFYLTQKGIIQASPFNSTYGVAGYVNENHPWIDGLLGEAIQTKLCEGFYGYQLGTQGVNRQVNAIWTALQKRGIRYSSIASSTVSGDNRFQHVRFVDETITSSQANCVDGSVVFASILRKIGLNVSIILVPGHAYVAVRDQENENILYAIETTMLSSGTLNAAIFEATNNGEHALKKIAAKLEDENEQEFIEIDIKTAREIGVQPIPYTR